MKEKLFSIFFCIYLFWNSILSSVLGQNGIEMDGMFMRITLVVIFAIAFYFYMAIKPRVDGERKAWVYIILFAILYYSTQYIGAHKQCINLILSRCIWVSSFVGEQTASLVA